MRRHRRPAEPLSDEALLAGLAAGEAAIGRVFVARFQGRVYGLAKSLVGDASLAEDIAQEALLRAWRHAAVFDPRRGSVTTWILTITRNLAIDALRIRRAIPLDPGSAAFLERRDRSPGPEETWLRSDGAARVRAAVGDLPADQRRALVLAAFYGYTAAEVSEAEGIPLGTAKTRIRTAMGKLRASLVFEQAEP